VAARTISPARNQINVNPGIYRRTFIPTTSTSSPLRCRLQPRAGLRLGADSLLEALDRPIVRSKYLHKSRHVFLHLFALRTPDGWPPSADHPQKRNGIRHGTRLNQVMFSNELSPEHSGRHYWSAQNLHLATRRNKHRRSDIELGNHPQFTATHRWRQHFVVRG